MKPVAGRVAVLPRLLGAGIALATAFGALPARSEEELARDAPGQDTRPREREDDLPAALGYLEPPRDGRAVVRTLDARLWRTDTEPWEEISVEALRSGAFVPRDEHSYGLAAVVDCTERYVGGSWRGQKTAWYLLPRNRVAAFDHVSFGERCTVYDQYQPALAQDVPVEKELNARMAELFPPPHLHRSSLYRRGLALAYVGRFEDARARLAQADGAVDVGFGSIDPEPRAEPGRGARTITVEETATLRAELVAALERAEQGSGPGDKAPVASTGALAAARTLPHREILLGVAASEPATEIGPSAIVSLAAYGLNGKPRYSAIRGESEPDRVRARTEIEPSEVAAVVEDLARDGFRVAELCGYLVDARRAISLVAEKNEPPLATEVRPALSLAELATADAELSAKGFRMRRLCGYGIGGDARFAAIWVQTGGPEVRWHVDLTPKKLLQELEGSPAAEWTLRDFGGYIVGGDDRYTLLFEKEGGARWEALAHLDAPTVSRRIAEASSRGLLPVVLRASVFAADDIRYTLLLRSPPGPGTPGQSTP